MSAHVCPCLLTAAHASFQCAGRPQKRNAEELTSPPEELDTASSMTTTGESFYSAGSRAPADGPGANSTSISGSGVGAGSAARDGSSAGVQDPDWRVDANKRRVVMVERDRAGSAGSGDPSTDEVVLAVDSPDEVKWPCPALMPSLAGTLIQTLALALVEALKSP